MDQKSTRKTPADPPIRPAARDPAATMGPTRTARAARRTRGASRFSGPCFPRPLRRQDLPLKRRPQRRQQIPVLLKGGKLRKLPPDRLRRPKEKPCIRPPQHRGVIEGIPRRQHPIV